MRKKHLLLKLIIKMTVLSFLLIAGIYGASYLLGPPKLMNITQTTLYDDLGEVIENNYGMTHIELDEVSPLLIESTIAIEDQHFYEHKGFDFKRIIRAIIKNIQTLSLKEGASTITQQLARNLYLTHEKTWQRKLLEAFYTIRLEMHYSKDDILAEYLNTIYYGHGAYGIEQASKTFFNKSANELSLAEAAMLAGIPKGPTYYSPFNNREKADARQKQILKRLLKIEQITQSDYYQAVNENLLFVKSDQIKNMSAPYFQDTVYQEAENILKLDSDAVKSGGYHIFTTLNTHLQNELENKASLHIEPESDVEVAALALQPNTGGITALVGGRSYQTSSFNRAIHAKRMVGSIIKPLLYYTALENGYTSSTLLMSHPTTFKLANGESYSPSNFNNYYANKPITLAQALALSDNIYAVKTNLFLGTDKLIRTAKKFRITSDLPEVPSLALGSASISMNEMVRAYGILANSGHAIDSYTIKKIVDRNGHVVYNRELTFKKQVLDRNKTFILTQMMTGMFDTSYSDYVAVTGEPIINKVKQNYAGKSGTTDTDSWMIGYSPQLVTGVWVGYDDNREMNLAIEKTYAKKIWADFMVAAHETSDSLEFSKPPGVIQLPIDPETGNIATPYCPRSHLMYFEKGTEPRESCRLHFPSSEEHHDDEDFEDGVLKRLLDWLF